MASIGPRHGSVQRVRRLSRHRRARSDERMFVIDGPVLLNEALRRGVTVHEVLAEPGADTGLLARAAAAGATVREVGPGVLAKAAATVTPHDMAAVAVFDEPAPPAVVAGLTGAEVKREGLLTLVLVGVNDPGNLGTLLRSGEAVGARAVFCCDGTSDPYGPKAVRASAGALFGLDVARDAAADEVVDALRDADVACVGAVVRGADDYDRVDLTGPVAIVLGSEAHGLPPDLTARLDHGVTIPMVGAAESLNVAMAGTVLCFEALRQRRRLR